VHGVHRGSSVPSGQCANHGPEEKGSTSAPPWCLAAFVSTYFTTVRTALGEVSARS